VPLLLILGVALVGAAFGLLAYARALPRLRAERRLAEVDAYGYPAASGGAEAPSGPLSAALGRLAERLGTAAMPRFDESREELRALLASAGVYRVAADTFLGYRLLAAVGLPLLWLWLGVTTEMAAAMVAIGLPVAALLGWRLPLLVLRDRARRRLDEIDYELPELVDSLVVTVEAGSGFDSALRMAAQELSGPLGDEIALTLREEQMGRSSEEALEGMARRADTAAMRAFVRAVVQGDRLGVSIGEIMRGLATEARANRRSAAEERAHRAPVKLLFPLVFLIFPSILIVLLYPALHNVTQTLGAS
jgi:tight adherence protein C